MLRVKKSNRPSELPPLWVGLLQDWSGSSYHRTEHCAAAIKTARLGISVVTFCKSTIWSMLGNGYQALFRDVVRDLCTTHLGRYNNNTPAWRGSEKTTMESTASLIFRIRLPRQIMLPNSLPIRLLPRYESMEVARHQAECEAMQLGFPVQYCRDNDSVCKTRQSLFSGMCLLCESMLSSKVFAGLLYRFIVSTWLRGRTRHRLDAVSGDGYCWWIILDSCIELSRTQTIDTDCCTLLPSLYGFVTVSIKH